MSEHTDPSAAFLEREIFEARGETFTLRQVLGATELFGSAGELWERLAEALACETYAAEEGFEIDADALQAEVDDFRYRRRLLNTEETEAWLSERRLSEDDLIDALAREHWRQRFQGELAQIRADYPPVPEALSRALWPELIVQDRLRPLAVELARRVVAAELAGAADESMSAATGLDAPAAGLQPGDPAPEAAGLPGWARCSPAWRRRLLDIERGYQAALRRALSPRALEAALVSRRLDLTRVGLLAARFTSIDGAREALLCVLEDKEPFEQAVGRAGAAREDRALYLAEAPETLQPFLVSAVPGETFLVEEEEEAEEGAENAGPLLMQVTEKSPPRLDDPEVRARLESSLLDQTFGPAVEEHVRWLCPLE